ncbi:MAG TPA: efflux RND transporter periplasmic adaptor subunit [Myxococcales bacterium]|nr:efflux RND transporter periplasmic adaptor subunit [Myxococcales bacterium]
MRFETAAVDRGLISARVTATGSLSPVITVQVGSQVSGRIQRLEVDFNSTVRRGQLLALIDPALFIAAEAQARANLSAARANLVKAQAQAEDASRQLQRQRQLRKGNLIAQADLDTAQTTADAANATVVACRAAIGQAAALLQQASTNLAYTRIYSPIDGVVISRNVDVGQTVAASLQAPTLFLLAEDLKHMQVDTNVAEADVGRLREGMAATFTVDAYPSEVFRGTIRQIRNAPQTLQNVVTYDAVIDVVNEDLKLKPGMTANATVVYAERRDVLRVPNAALRFRPPPGLAPSEVRPPGNAPARDRRVVWVLRGERPLATAIRTGVSDGTVSELLEGDLHAGDLLVVEAVASGKSGAGSFGRVL